MKKIYLLLLTLPFLLQACLMDDKDLFPESAADRMNTAIKHHQEILMGATNGWVMEYFPEKEQSYGGYTMFVKFEAKDKVTVASELAKPDQTESSMYQLIGDNGPVLTFNTHNSLFHYFSEPKNPDGIGPDDSGMRGDYEFLVLESTPEKVTMKGKKTGNRIVMTPIAAGISWTDLMKQHQATINLLTGQDFVLSMGALKGDVALTYHVLNFTYPEGEAIATQRVPFRVIPGAIELYQPLEIGGKKITKMTITVSADEKQLVTFADAASGITITEIFYTMNEILVRGNWYFAYSTLGAYGKECWDIAKIGIDKEHENLYTASLNRGTAFAFASNPNGTTKLYKGELKFKYELVNKDQIKLKFAGTASGYGTYYYQNVEGFQSYLYPLMGEFKLTGNRIKNPTTIQLQNIDDPENVYVLYNEPVYFPYDK